MSRSSGRPSPPSRRHRTTAVGEGEPRTHTPSPRRGSKRHGAIEDEFWGDGPSWTASSTSHDRGDGADRHVTRGSAVGDSDPTDPLPAVGLFDFEAHGDDGPLGSPAIGGGTTAVHSDVRQHHVVGWDVMDWDVESWVDAWHDPAASGVFDETITDASVIAPRWEVARGEGHSARPNPALLRLGMFIAVVALAVPFVMGLTSGSSGTLDRTVDEIVEAADSATPTAAPLTDPTAPASTAGAGGEAAAPDESPGAITGPSADAEAEAAGSGEAASASAGDVALATSVGSEQVATPPAASTATPACAGQYEIATGDYWIRLADSAGIRLADLLAANGATIDTMLVPGRSICIPAGAAMPSPPPTPTSRPSSSGSSAQGTSPTTAAPKAPAPPASVPKTSPTTAAPTTTVRPASPTEAQAIIRDVWPDDLEERALEIARRESKYIPTAKNWCCYGLFQIHWSAHRGWLADLGITSSSQLLDARTNATAAYALYQRSGGFGPWGG